MKKIFWLSVLLIPMACWGKPPAPNVSVNHGDEIIAIQNLQEEIKTQENRSSDGLGLFLAGLGGDVLGVLLLSRSDLSNQTAADSVLLASSGLSVVGVYEFVDSQIQINPMRDKEIGLLLQIN
jgi:hypothetical protein